MSRPAIFDSTAIAYQATRWVSTSSTASTTTTNFSVRYFTAVADTTSCGVYRVASFYDRIAGMSQAGAQENKENLEAAKKAWKLLLQVLTPAQRRTLLDHGWFDCVGADGHTYRLMYRRHGNVTRLGKDGETEKAWCGHFGEALPIADNLTAQLLILTVNPSDYTEKANRVLRTEFNYCVPMGGYKERLQEIGLAEHLDASSGAWLSEAVAA